MGRVMEEQRPLAGSGPTAQGAQVSRSKITGHPPPGDHSGDKHPSSPRQGSVLMFLLVKQCFPEGFSGAFPGALPHRQPAGWLQHQGMLIGGAGNEEVRAGAPQGSVAGLVLT